MPEEGWIEACKTKVQEYIDNAYAVAGEIVPRYELQTVWAEPGELADRILFRTELSENVRYLTTRIVHGGESVIKIEALSSAVMESKKEY